jgi:hypothetical protein
MDAAVLAAIAKWPDVPDVYGWLALTARGQWRLRGEPIGNAAIRDFIGRNYAADRRGCWHFQNGPQRVFVALELTPWVYRQEVGGGLAAHTGAVPRQLRSAALLDDGRLLAVTELGPGVIDDRDSATLLPALVRPDGAGLEPSALEPWLEGAFDAALDAAALGLAGGRVPLQRLRVAQLGARFGFERSPSP